MTEKPSSEETTKVVAKLREIALGATYSVERKTR